MKNLNMLCLIIVGIILGFGHINDRLFTETEYVEKAINLEYLWPVIAYAVVAALVFLFRYVVSEGENK